MRVSHAWLADHFSGSDHVPSPQECVDLFVRHVAEVDAMHAITIDRDTLYAGTITQQSDTSVSVYIPEIDATYTVAGRSIPFPNAWYIVRIENGAARWATLVDLGGHADALFPSVDLDTEAAKRGSWRDSVPSETHILDIDNAGITHRPDLWGHRGWAREVDTVCNYSHGTSQLRSWQQMGAPVHVASAGQADITYQPQIRTDGCHRFVTYYISDVTARPSSLSIALRLAWVGVKPHNLLVDLTNYVMYDIGQPMHAFDAEALPQTSITVRDAHTGEQMQALDGTQIELTEHDMVVASGDTALSVAGIIGGSASGISEQTRAILLEAAHFDPTRVRRTSSRMKRRTESSMRFEKDLDPYATNAAIERYMAMLAQHASGYHAADCAVAAGELPELPQVVVPHGRIQNTVGRTACDMPVAHIMRLLGCHVAQNDTDDGVTYIIDIPSYRRTDLTRAEDIVEEVARIIGYDNIMYDVPYFPMYPRSLQESQRVQTIKQHCAYALSMREIVTYGFFDERWLSEIGYQPQHAVSVTNPVSEHMQRLATSLVPQMLHAVSQNVHAYTSLRFFEWGTVWTRSDDNGVHEDEMLTCIMFAKRDERTIYDIKHELYSLFRLLHMEVAWQPIEDENGVPWWADKEAVAHLMYRHDGHWYTLGYAGRVRDALMQSVAAGSAYVCELYGYVLRTYTATEPAFYGIPKYQSTWFDVSLRVGADVTVAQLETDAKQADPHIYDVYLVDLYEKAVEGYARSVTLRITAGAREKTLTRDEIEVVRERVHAALRAHNVEVR